MLSAACPPTPVEASRPARPWPERASGIVNEPWNEKSRPAFAGQPLSIQPSYLTLVVVVVVPLPVVVSEQTLMVFIPASASDWVL